MASVRTLDAYKQYVALKLHFTSDKYDYFAANGAIRANRESLEKRNDFYQFQKLAKKHDQKSLESLIIANLLENKEIWIGDLLSEEAAERNIERQKVTQSLTYTFKKDLETLTELSKTDKNERPLLIRATLQKEISLETFIILATLYGLYKKLDRKLGDDIIWKDLKFKCIKYTPFIKFDRKKFDTIVKEHESKQKI